MYLSPEVVKNCLQDCQNDIWVLGCIILEMLTEQPPRDFAKLDIFQIQGFSRRLPNIPKKLSKDAKKFIKRMFCEKFV